MADSHNSRKRHSPSSANGKDGTGTVRSGSHATNPHSHGNRQKAPGSTDSFSSKETTSTVREGLKTLPPVINSPEIHIETASTVASESSAPKSDVGHLHARTAKHPKVSGHVRGGGVASGDGSRKPTTVDPPRDVGGESGGHVRGGAEAGPAGDAGGSTKEEGSKEEKEEAEVENKSKGKDGGKHRKENRRRSLITSDDRLKTIWTKETWTIDDGKLTKVTEETASSSRSRETERKTRSEQDLMTETTETTDIGLNLGENPRLTMSTSTRTKSTGIEKKEKGDHKDTDGVSEGTRKHGHKTTRTKSRTSQSSWELNLNNDNPEVIRTTTLVKRTSIRRSRIEDN